MAEHIKMSPQEAKEKVEAPCSIGVKNKGSGASG